MVANRRMIFIPALKDTNGVWMETREKIGSLLINEFSSLFKADDLRRSERLGDFISFVFLGKKLNIWKLSRRRLKSRM